MNIGFDLDRIFVDTPPFIPDWIIERLYKKKDRHQLVYRIPGKFEQRIRQFSHMPQFRPALEKNIAFLHHLSASKKYHLFLISSRFNFLKKQTETILSQYHLSHVFTQTCFNLHNEQPHLFKNRLIVEKNIDVFVDDDLSLLKRLALAHPQKKFYWFNERHNKPLSSLATNLYAITQLKDIL